MKSKFHFGWKAVLVLASLPFVAAGLQGLPADDPPIAPDGQSATNQAAPASYAQPAGPVLPNLQLYGGTAEMVKLAQSGVGEGVMMSYISNTTARFSLGSDQIIYLNDLGVSSAVVTAMIQHDAALGIGSTLPPATVAYPPDQPDVAAYPPTQTMDLPVPATATDYADYNTYPPAGFSTPDDTAYFYDTLAPYGSWINVAGYGLCWQPVVYVSNHDWRPYSDRGRWLYTDHGWYWQSDYSWGWAAFHYGRWFRDANAGWVWLPNRVWGPAWVSWRNSEEYSGWAPLPPSANFVPGAGLRFQNHAVSASFEFGLRRGLYTFIPTERLADYSPARYRATGAAAARIFGETAVINNFTTENRQVVNRGVDPAVVEARSGTPIRRAVIRDLAAGTGPIQPDRLAKQGDSLVLFRTPLPATPVRRSNISAAATGNGNGGSPAGRRFETSSTINSGAPKTAAVVTAASPNGARTVSGAPTVSGPDAEHKPHVQVYVRPDAQPGVQANRTPVAANAGNFAIRPGQTGAYQPDRTRPETFTVYQRPDLSGNSPQSATAYKVELSPGGSSSQRITVYQRPDLSGSVQPDQHRYDQQDRGMGNNNFNRNPGNQYSPFGAAAQPAQSSSPAQAPLLLPSRGNGNYYGEYSQPAHNSAPAYSPPAGRSAPAYNPQPQPIQLPPSRAESAPVQESRAEHSAPAQSSQSSSSQSSASQSSGRR